MSFLQAEGGGNDRASRPEWCKQKNVRAKGKKTQAEPGDVEGTVGTVMGYKGERGGWATNEPEGSD